MAAHHVADVLLRQVVVREVQRLETVLLEVGRDPGAFALAMRGQADDKAFAQFLDTLGYPWVEETQNPVYRMFLQS